MTTLPEHDPLDPKAPTPPEGQPASSNGEKEIPSLDVMCSGPFLTPAGLAGTSWDEPQPNPVIPEANFERPFQADDTDLKGTASLTQHLTAAGIPQVDTTDSTQPAMDWPQPLHLFPKGIEERLTPQGRKPVKNTNPSPYGNLAGSTVAGRDGFQPIHLSHEENPDQPALTEDAELKGAGLPGEGFNPHRIPPMDQAEPTEAGRDTFEPIDLSPVQRFSDPPAETPAFLKALFDLESASPAVPDQPPLIPTEPAEHLLFQSLYQPKILPPPARIPHLGHFLILAILTLLGLLGASLLTRSALQFHLFGIFTVQKAEADIHYTLGSMAALYLITFGASLLIFPLIWHKGLFAGLQWNAAAAQRRFWLLMAAACACFVLAMVDELLLPGPANAPIDKLFETRTAAWLLFAFGVTLAPFFEEIVFRGFLLPALCTAWDWFAEKASGNPALPQDENGHPQWSIFAMVFGSVATSVPFAAMHAEQTGYSLGPFLLLIAVSLVLCATRLSTRSLAASVLVHASYNFLLFSIMFLGTSGFQHLDKL
ncbi:MAG TPA: CPBP family intramembrane glutamic endopeptidase [Terracidiphilus sp.]|jgi:hypothetical protein